MVSYKCKGMGKRRLGGTAGTGWWGRGAVGGGGVAAGGCRRRGFRGRTVSRGPAEN